MKATANLYPSTFAFDRSLQIANRTTSFDFSVSAGPLLPSDDFSRAQPLRGGLTPVNVSLVSSQPSVGTLKPAALMFNPGDSQATAAFTPSAAGNTILTISQPSGFTTPNGPSQLVVTVN